MAKMPAKSQQMTGFQIFSAHQNRQYGYEGGVNKLKFAWYFMEIARAEQADSVAALEAYYQGAHGYRVWYINFSKNLFNRLYIYQTKTTTSYDLDK